MYNKENIKNMFHKRSLGLVESMEKKSYYRARILDLHTDLKKRGIVSHTEPKNLSKLTPLPIPLPSQVS